MKKGRGSRSAGLRVAQSGRASWWWVSSWAHLSIASSKGDKADWSSLRWRISLRTVRRPGGRWRRGEAVDVADVGGDRVGEHPADSGHGAKQRHVAVVGTEPTQVALAVCDLAVELVDQAQARVDRCLPWLRQS